MLADLGGQNRPLSELVARFQRYAKTAAMTQLRDEVLAVIRGTR